MCVLRNKGWGQGLEKGGRKRCSDREIINRERGTKGKKEEERERSNTLCSRRKKEKNEKGRKRGGGERERDIKYLLLTSIA